LPAHAQSLTLDLGDEASSTGRIVQLLALLTVLSLAPGILVMVTSFTRIVVVLSFLRSAIGIQQTPPNIVIVSLALFLSAFIMSPTLERSYNDGIAPLIEQKIDETQAYKLATRPLEDFMLGQVRPQDLNLFMDIGKVAPVASPADTPL